MMIGSNIGQYRVVALLGEGGMGEVYRAVDTMLEREVAIKALHRFLTQDASRLERFRSEAVTLARLNHPNIAILHNFFEAGQDHYMVMEYVEGETFESLMQRPEKLPLRTVLEWFCQSLRGFEHAHARNVIHRDIKPANLMLNSEGVVKITDFGIARVVGTQRLTQTGKLIGTLEYMSPEQVRGEEQDARSDIYSLGILLHELATGQVPFSGTSDYEVMRSHLETVPRPPREFDGSLPTEIEAAILKALAKKPEERFANVQEFRAVLEKAIAQLPADGGRVVLPMKGTREAAALVAESLVPEGTPASSGATRAAQSPTRVAGKSSAAKAPTWLTPKIALAAGVAFLLAILLLAFATRRSPESTPPSAVETGTVKTEATPTSEKVDYSGTPIPDDNSSAIVSPSVVKRPQPAITPIPTPRPTAKPTPKPTAKPKPQPRPKPKPRATVRKHTTTKRRSTPKRRTTPKRSAPKRRSAPKKGRSVADILKNS